MANYPVPYQNPWNYSGTYGQTYPQYAQNIQTPQTQTTGSHGIIWVDGEVGAKAYQLPAGWPANTPIALWDTNDTVIYLKSTNPMGMPNPLQKAKYKLEEYQQVGRRSEEQAPVPVHDMSDYVRKEDLEKMKQDLMETIGTMGTSGTGVRRSSKGES